MARLPLILLGLLAATVPLSAQPATGRLQKHVIVLTAACGDGPEQVVKRLEKTDPVLNITTADGVSASCGGDFISFDTVKVTADPTAQGAIVIPDKGLPSFVAAPRVHTHGEFTFTGRTSRGPEFIHPTKPWITGMDAYDDGLANDAFDANRPEHNDPACFISQTFTAGNGSMKQGDCIRYNNAGNLGTKNPDGSDYLGLATYASVYLNPAPNAGAFVGFTWMVARLYVFSVYTVTSGPPPSECVDLKIDHIEVVQTVQDEKNGVPWIADKTTMARVFVRLVDPSKPPVAGVSGVLHGVRSGQELADSPRSPDNVGITARADVLREQLDYSLNFKLPQGWTVEERQMGFQAEVKVPGCPDKPDSAKLTYSIGGPIQKVTRPLRIAWLPYCYQPSGANRSCIQEELVPSYDFIVRKLYPLPSGSISLMRLSLPPPPPITDVLPPPNAEGKNPVVDAFLERFRRDLTKLYLASFAPQFDQLVAVVPDIPNIGIAATSDPVFQGGLGKAVIMVQQTQSMLTKGPRPPENPKNANHYNAIALAHEMGHNFGRHHTNNAPSSVLGHGCDDPDKRSDWPSYYPTADVQQVGFDFVTGKVTPANDSELMGYCFNNEVPEWISPFTFTKLAKVFGVQDVLNAGNQPEAGGQGSHSSDSLDQIIISGWLRQDGTAGGLDPAYHVPSVDTPTPSQDDASQCIRFSGSSGTISDYCFPLAFENYEVGRPLDLTYFAFKTSIPPGTTKVSLLAGTNEVATLNATSGPPVINIVTPQSGDHWNTGPQTITWAATDPDGQPLTYIVLYSEDGGTSWLPLAMDIRDSQYTFDPARIDGGKDVRFRVMVTDGLNSASVDVGPIEVIQTPGIAIGSGVLDFRNQTAGQSVSQAFAITNTGSGPATVSGFTSDNAAFQVSMPQAPLIIAAATSASVTVEWRVAGSGPQTANLTIASNDPNNPLTALSIKGGAFPNPVPNIDVTPGALDFGTVAAGQTKDLKIAIGDSGSGPLTVNSISSDSARFSIVTPVLPLTIAAGDSSEVTLRFAPAAAGAFSGTFTISNNDPSKASLTIQATGTATAPAPPVVSVSPSALNFGSVTVGKPQSLTVSIANVGTAVLNISSISSDNPVFTPGAVTASIPGGGSLNLSVNFAPVTAGSQSGTLKITTNDPAHATVQIPLIGTGVAAVTTTVTLAVDGGKFSGGVGLQNSNTAVFVNRLTPPSYPATLTSIQIYFGDRNTGLTLNSPITLVAASNPSGLSNFSAASAGVIKLYATQVVSLGSFTTYTLSPSVTITSGDFVVGFVTPNPAGLFPADEDQETPSQGRSYISNDGSEFAIVDSFGKAVAGNFGIRAVVTLGGTGTNEPVLSGPDGKVVAGRTAQIQANSNATINFRSAGIVTSSAHLPEN